MSSVVGPKSNVYWPVSNRRNPSKIACIFAIKTEGFCTGRFAGLFRLPALVPAGLRWYFEPDERQRNRPHAH
jgi:hypothetical protein